MTLAILARDPETGNFGVGLTTSTAAAGGLDGVAHVPRFGIALGIAVPGYCHKVGGTMLYAGLGAEAAMAAMVGSDSGAAYRQLGVLDTEGRVAGFTGEKCVDHASHKVGADYLVMGNWLASRQVIDGMERGFLDSKGETFARRLIASLEGGRDAGGEISHPLISSVVVVFGDREGTHVLDLRCDGAEGPVAGIPEDPVARILKSYERVAGALPAIELGRTQPHTMWADILQTS